MDGVDGAEGRVEMMEGEIVAKIMSENIFAVFK